MNKKLLILGFYIFCLLVGFLTNLIVNARMFL